MSEAVIEPANSLVLIMDPVAGQVPGTMGGGLVAATESCIAVGTLASADGPTTIRLVEADNLDANSVPDLLVWQGQLSTPTTRIVIGDVLGNVLLEHSVGTSTHLRLFANDPREPNYLVAVID